VPVLQLNLNAGALIGGAVIWKLYVDNLKLAGDSGSADSDAISSSNLPASSTEIASWTPARTDGAKSAFSVHMLGEWRTSPRLR
jgi:hypothetical protein